MKMIAKKRLKIESPIVEVPGKDGSEPTYKRKGMETWIQPGQKFDASADIAKVLIANGHAVDASAPAETKPVVPTPSGPTVTLNDPPAAS